mgnify:CR=1 FL=1
MCCLLNYTTVNPHPGVVHDVCTVTDFVPDIVPDVAVIVTVPFETPVTKPVELTVATASLLLVHVNDGHVNAAPN